MTDIKDLLGRAFDDEEPPLGIDRDEVFRAGRQKVRRRHRLAAGGVVAAVVVAIGGAAMLTDFVDITPDKELPPAAEAPPAPPGPELPLTPSSKPAADGAPRFTAERAATLTDQLHDSIGRGAAVAWPGQPNPPAFRVDGANYLYESDFVGTSGEGVLQVAVSFAAPGAAASCDDLGEVRDCVLEYESGNPVAQVEWTSTPGGEQRNMVVVILPNGTKVTAMSSNFSRRLRDEGKQPFGEPVIDIEKLRAVITKSGFSVR